MEIKDVEITRIEILESLISGLKPELKTGEIISKELKETHHKEITFFNTINSKKELFDVLKNIANNVNENDGVLLFLEFHGGTKGITILDENNVPENVNWSELTNFLVDINKNTAIGLVIVFSCCFGIYYFTQATIEGIAAYHLMLGCDDEIYGPELLNINRTLINGIAENHDIESLVSKCNEYINGAANYSYLDLYDGFIGAYKKYFRDLFDENKLKIRISDLVNQLPSNYPAQLNPGKLIKDRVLSRDYNEAKFNELRDRIFLADQHLLYHRYDIDFDDVCAELEVENKFLS